MKLAKVCGALVWTVITVGILSVVVGCGAEKVPATPTALGAAAAEGAASPRPAPGQYSVSVSWQDPTPAQEFILYRRDEAGGEFVEVGRVTGDQNKFEDPTAVSDTEYTYRVDGVVDGIATTRTQTKVAVPKDMLVRGEMKGMHKITGVNRLFLTKDARIRTGAEGLTIRVNELLSADGAIETFASDDIAAALGADAGRIDIRVAKASGTLRLVSRGQTGGPGAEGRSGDNGTAGAKGSAGEWGINPFLMRNDQLLAQGLAGVVKRDKPAPSDGKWRMRGPSGLLFVCSKKTGDGGDGTAGTRGGVGGKGSDGGASARILFKTEKASAITLETTLEGGAGGKPGKAGPRGMGGAAGAAGDLDAGHLCTEAKKGSKGADGAAGPEGQPGSSGKVQPLCKVIAGEKSDGCRDFAAEEL